MISLGVCTDNNLVKKLYKENEICFNQNSFAVTAICGQEMLGYCLYDLTDKEMVLHLVNPIGDLPLADGIIRSTLHVAAERSILNAFYDNDSIKSVLELLDFIENETEKKVNINKLFTGCNSCKKNS